MVFVKDIISDLAVLSWTVVGAIVVEMVSVVLLILDVVSAVVCGAFVLVVVSEIPIAVVAWVCVGSTEDASTAKE